MIEALSPVLIANRGEVAVRVARTVRRLGLRAIAVYSDADAGAPHVRAADAAVRIGPADAAASYLSIDALLAAAAATGARSVHPGWGFLAESAPFAQAVADAGLTWIGPPPAAIAAVGDKARAKALARAAGVPVVPGLEPADGGDLADDEIAAFCARAGFPVLVKAVAGGGGKGMRVVRDAAALPEAVAAARREAAAAFGDGRLLVERWLDRPRHLEVQVLADRHGGVIHLGERECSLQRRHQKVVEEAPSPAVDGDLRARLGAAAVALARACGYVGAGTVELIAPGPADDDPDAPPFWFLEMNARLQVEHPVTEAVTGVDLVEQQLRIAAGEPLALAQDDLAPSGHAVEARLYAEDPAAGFLPATGVVRRWRPPRGAGVRVDAALAEGLGVTTHYDPLLAKVIAHGPDRPTALARLARALGELELLGVATNAAFTRALLADDAVRAGALDTGLLERARPRLTGPAPDDLLAAAALVLRARDAAALAQRTAVPLGWRSDGAAATWRRRVAVDGAVVELAVRGEEVRVGPPPSREGADGDDAAPARAWHGAAALDGDGGATVTLDGVARRYALADDPADGTLWIGRDGHQLALAPARAEGRGAAAADATLAAPMPGRVLLVHVADGDRVAAGEVLLVLESMKMELAVTAPRDGVVTGLAVAPGDRVGARQVLAHVHDEGDGAPAAAPEAVAR